MERKLIAEISFAQTAKVWLFSRKTIKNQLIFTNYIFSDIISKKRRIYDKKNTNNKRYDSCRGIEL